MKKRVQPKLFLLYCFATEQHYANSPFVESTLLLSFLT